MKQRPGRTLGMHHVALCVSDMAASERFYVDLMGMAVEWRPDADNLYLTSGNDNLALHKSGVVAPPDGQRLDHIGFLLGAPEQVDEWFGFLSEHDVRMRTGPRTHRDGARSFYCYDPDGTTVQLLFHPPLADSRNRG